MDKQTHFLLDYETFSVGVHSNSEIQMPDWIKPFIIKHPRNNHFDANFFFGNYDIEKTAFSGNRAFLFLRKESPEKHTKKVLLKIMFILIENEKKFGIAFIHSSSLAINGSVALFLGPSGEGKSTIVKTLDGGSRIIHEDTNIYHTNDNCVSPNLIIGREDYIFNKMFLPVKTIFLLEKSLKNKASRISKEEALPKVISSIFPMGKSNEYKENIANRILENSDAFLLQHCPFKKEELENALRRANLSGCKRPTFSDGPAT